MPGTVGHSDILDYPHRDCEDGLCLTSFYGGEPNQLSKIRSTGKHFFKSRDFVLSPSRILEELDIWGSNTVREYLVVLIISFGII